tara:strand:- start:57 stop:248 length:192 start_codon:yes stop_codon:yes gene_type:complete
MTYRELLAELNTMSDEALDNPVRIDLEGDHVPIRLWKRYVETRDGQTVDCTKFITLTPFFNAP